MTSTRVSQQDQEAEQPRTSFNLLDEPWLPVRRLDGGAEELSLLDGLRRSSELREVVGELPTTAFALVRLLLAVLYRALAADEPRGEWGRLWTSRQLPWERLVEYLEAHRDRFDLLHAEVPFLQVAGARTLSGKPGGLDAVIADVPNNIKFFTTRAGVELERISYAEAARWLVHAQAFDPSGIKSGLVGDARVKGGKNYPIGVAWPGLLGGVLVEGATLRETLLLNLVLVDDHGAPLPIDDRPVWEREPLTAAPEHRTPAGPRGPADLLTWPSRRVRLVHDGSAVTGVVLSNGDPLPPQDRFLEPMTAWRRSTTQEKKLGRSPVYMPREHVPERSLWRGLQALLPQTSSAQQRSEGATSLPPRSLEWLARVSDDGHLPADHVVRTRAVGVHYGSNSSVVDDVVDDALAIHVVLVAEQGKSQRGAVLEAVRSSEEAVGVVVRLAGDLATAGGGDADGARERAREAGYFSLDAPFRTWVSGITAGDDPDELLSRWAAEAHSLLSELVGELVTAAGPTAWVGREIREGRASRHVSTPEADLRARSGLRRVLRPDRQGQTTATPGEEDRG